MGYGCRYICRGCGYSFTASFGIGMFFPFLYRKTLEDGRQGEHGEKLQRFLLDHPDGAVDCESCVIRCTACGNLQDGMDLAMYLPRDGYTPEVSEHPFSMAMPAEGMLYVTRSDLQEHYRLRARYPHRCEKCGAPARTLRAETLSRRIASGEVACPCCGGQLGKAAPELLWD